MCVYRHASVTSRPNRKPSTRPFTHPPTQLYPHTAAAAVERRRLQERAEALVRARLGEVFQLANASVDHLPPSMYHFEVGRFM